jgi:nicotinamidase-related amidase
MPFSVSRFSSPALLVVDMQNDFVREGAPMEVPDARASLESHRRLIACFRGIDTPVIYTKFLATDTPSLLWLWSPKCEPPTSACRRGVRRRYLDCAEDLECTDVVREIYPKEGDLVVEKFGYGSFHGTGLSDRLREMRVASLIVTGTVTQICVEETAREAFHNGFATTLVADAVSSFAPDLHAATLKNFAMKFGWVDDSETVIRNLTT